MVSGLVFFVSSYILVLRYNRTAFHIAARKDLLEAAKWLINKGADLEAKDKYGITP